jgi:hypothetical protein
VIHIPFQMPFVALTGRPDSVDHGHRMIMMGDEIVGPEERVQLQHLDVRPAGAVQRDRGQDEVDVLAPVVHFRYVGFLEGVVNGQGVKPERLAQDRLTSLGGSASKSSQTSPCGVGERRRQVRGLEVKAGLGAVGSVGIRIIGH